MAAIRQIQIQLHTLTRRQHNSINNDWHTSNTHLISPGSVQCSYTERYKRSVCIRSPKGQTYSSVLFTWERHLCLNHSFSSVAVSKESGLSLLWWEKKKCIGDVSMDKLPAYERLVAESKQVSVFFFQHYGLKFCFAWNLPNFNVCWFPLGFFWTNIPQQRERTSVLSDIYN